jgi:hypothetical protein
MNILSVIPVLVAIYFYLLWKKTKERIYKKIILLCLSITILDVVWYIIRVDIQSLQQLRLLNQCYFILSNTLIVIIILLYINNRLADKNNKKIWLEFIERSEKEGIKKIALGMAVIQDNKILVLEQTKGDQKLIGLPSILLDIDQNLANINIQKILTITLQKETSLILNKIIKPLGEYNYTTNSGEVIAQYNYLVQSKPGKVEINHKLYSNYYFISPSDKQYSSLNLPKEMLL